MSINEHIIFRGEVDDLMTQIDDLECKVKELESAKCDLMTRCNQLTQALKKDRRQLQDVLRKVGQILAFPTTFCMGNTVI
jgi:DNA repair ATPase RecN